MFDILPAQVSGVRVRLTIDTETYRMRPGLTAPPLVCLSYCTQDKKTGLMVRADAIAFMREALKRSDVLWIGQNIAFDFVVLAAADIDLLPGIMQAYDENRVIDVRIRDKLMLLAVGQLADEGETGAKRQAKFSLDQMVLRRFGHRMTEAQREKLISDKKNPKSWRLRFRELADVPLDEWPQEAKDYATDDALLTYEILLDQVREQHEKTGTNKAYIADEYAQVRSAFWLQLARVWGVRTDAKKVQDLTVKLSASLAEIDIILKKAGILKGKHQKGKVHWSKDMNRLRALVAQGYGDALSDKQKTETGLISTDKDTLLEVPHPHAPGCVLAYEDDDGKMHDGKCTDDCLVGILHAVADRNAVEKILSTYVPALMRGTQVPICPGWNELVASGRTSCSEPNLQNPPRKGEVRECFIPRPGHVFASVDYSFLELCTLAQACLDLLGFSTLAEAINNDIDPHLDMAAELLGITYEEALKRKKDPEVKDKRQLSKALNFGLPGGLGAEKFILYARTSYNVELTLKRARELKPIWLKKWPEMRPYQSRVGRLCDETGSFTLTQLRSFRLRGDCQYTAACNSYFQGLAADGAKRAGWLIAKECYLEDPYRDGAGPTALYGCRLVLFLHDEFILEVPEDPERAAAATARLEHLMVVGMKEYVPDVKIKVEPTLMKRWYKAAEPVYVNNRLTVWEPKALIAGPVGVAA